MTLDQFQADFIRMLRGQAPSYPLEKTLVSYQREHMDARLSIYRNNYYQGLISALAATYTSIKTMVGDVYFSALIKAYIDDKPPSEPAMVHLGWDFPAFVADFEPLVGYPYLADLAHLDWAYHSAYHAEEKQPLPPAAFAAISPDRLSYASFDFHPSYTLLKSQYAVFNLWQYANAEEDTDKTAIPEVSAAQTVMIVRPDAIVDIYSLGDGNSTFLSELTDGKSLGESLESALNVGDDTFNPSEAVNFLVSSGAITNIIEH